MTTVLRFTVARTGRVVHVAGERGDILSLAELLRCASREREASGLLPGSVRDGKLAEVLFDPLRHERATFPRIPDVVDAFTEKER